MDFLLKKSLLYLGRVVMCLLTLALTACESLNGASSQTAYANNAPNTMAQAESHSRYHNPSSYVVLGKRYYVLKSAHGYDKVGYASWYGSKFHGQHTSSHEAYNMFSMTAASTTLPIPTYVRVTNLGNGRSVVVKVNDRGPFRSDRIIDLSYAAAKALGYANIGTARVRVTALDGGSDSMWRMANNESNAAPAPQKTTTVRQQNPTPVVATRHNQQTPKLAMTKKPIYLQVGAYRDRDKALRVSKQIAALVSADVSVQEAYHNHTKIYRVHVGPLASVQSSDVKHILAEHGYEQTLSLSG